MCGLVGMAGSMGFKHRAAMKTMLFFNTLRGKDSTGVCVYDQRKNEIDTKKMTCPGYDFVNQAWIDSFLGSPDGVWLGHGRAKTVGDVNRLNAHPFLVYNDKDQVRLFGAHNGTLQNKYDLEKEVGDQFGTDSEALINLIAKVGPKEAISKARGAWALTWWDAATDCIHFLRNKERPLVYTFTEDRKVLMWASEMWMIRIACAREGIDLVSHPKEKGGDPIFWMVNEDTLFSFKIPEFKAGDMAFGDPEKEGGLLGEPEKKFFQGRGYGAGPLTGNYGHQGAFDDDDAELAEWLRRDEQKTNQTGKEKGKDDESKTENANTVVGFEGKEVDAQIVEELKKSGCDWCGDAIKSNAFGWLDEFSLVCMPCIRGEHFHVDVKKSELVPHKLVVIPGGKAS